MWCCCHDGETQNLLVSCLLSTKEKNATNDPDKEMKLLEWFGLFFVNIPRYKLTKRMNESFCGARERQRDLRKLFKSLKSFLAFRHSEKLLKTLHNFLTNARAFFREPIRELSRSRGEKFS